jgi:hypothetical protein
VKHEDVVRDGDRLAACEAELLNVHVDFPVFQPLALLERIGPTYVYRLTDKGVRAGGLFILFQKRVCGPSANSLFQHRPEDRGPQPAKIEQASHHADIAVQHLIDVLAA